MIYPLLIDVAKNSSDITCLNNQTVQWIYHVFHQCVNDVKEEIGFTLGLISICCWICASVPQLYENYKRKKVEEALSFLFLMFWLLGDASNLIGCFLTHQLPIQIITAVYYVAMDIVMILQFLYYRNLSRRMANLEQNAAVNGGSNSTSAARQILPCCLLLAFLPLSFFGKQYSLGGSPDVGPRRIGRTLLAKDLGHGGPILPMDAEDIAGYAIGCVSSLFYVGSRLPQIIKNVSYGEVLRKHFVTLVIFFNQHKRRRTDGVSIHLFILAVAGNALYGASVLLQDPDPGDTYFQYVMKHLPWLIGSLGTMFLDFVALSQIIYFNPPCYKTQETTEDDEPLLA